MQDIEDAENLPNLQPTLVGKTVLIRPLRSDDWQSLFSAASDPLIWAGHPVPERCTAPVFREYFDTGLSSQSGFVFIDRSTSEMVGSSRYHGHDPARSEIEIGWTFLVRNKWGGGTNREIKRLMLQHAFQFVDTVVFWVGETNWRSRSAMAKIGAVLHEGVVSRPQTGGPHVVFEITKQNFASGPLTRQDIAEN